MMRNKKQNLVVGPVTMGLLSVVSLGVLPSTASAHHPDRECQPVRPRVEVIPPMGHRIPDHRRCYNRPSQWIGHLAYKFAPTSQEAMAWHAAEHRGDYDRDCPVRVVPRYEFSKPWEVLPMGARPNRNYRPSDQPVQPVESNRIDELDNPFRPSDQSSKSNESTLQDAAVDEMSLQEMDLGIDSSPPSLEPPKPRVEPTSEKDFEF